MDRALTPAEEAALDAAYEEYRVACLALRARHLISDEGADRVVRARVALCRQLVLTGWAPPAPVRIQLERDEALLATPQITDELLAQIA